MYVSQSSMLQNSNSDQRQRDYLCALARNTAGAVVLITGSDRCRIYHRRFYGKSLMAFFGPLLTLWSANVTNIESTSRLALDVTRAKTFNCS